MPKCSACGCYMEGHFGVCAACKNAREFQKGQESIQQATEDAARVTRAAALLAHASHEQSMQAEAKRLEELQKQTQIMLEGQISNEEAYQSGYDLEEDLLDLSLTEGGELHWDISAPFYLAWVKDRIAGKPLENGCPVN